MRTTLDLPDELYRSLKARAALKGAPVREIVTHLLELGLRADLSVQRTGDRRRPPPPVAIAPRGVPILPMSHQDKVRAEESQDEARHGRPA